MWIQIGKWAQACPVSHLICLAFLAGISVYDICFRKITTFSLVTGGLLAVFYGFAQRETPWYLLAAGGAVGLLMVGLARITGEAVGYGDGWLVLVLGLYLGLWDLLTVLAAAWFFLALAAGICLVRKKWSRKTSIPMAPFLTAGFITLLLLQQN